MNYLFFWNNEHLLGFSGIVYLDSNSNELDYDVTPQYTLTITVSDGSKSDTVELTVNVIKVNTAPYFTNLPNSVNVDEDVPGANNFFDIDATDDDGDSLTYSLPGVSPANPTFTIHSGSEYQQYFTFLFLVLSTYLSRLKHYGLNIICKYPDVF